MSGLCRVAHCQAIARIVIADPGGDEIEVCVPHWKDALDASDGCIRGVRLLSGAACMLPECDGSAVNVVNDLDGTPRPVCQQHLDDLSWVELPNVLLPDSPGWSRG